MKGFKDSDGKFRPISNTKGIRKKSDKTRETTGMQMTSGIRKKKASDGSRIKEIKIWKYQDASDDLQEKILEKLRNNVGESGDNFFAQDEGILFDKDEKKDGQDIGLTNVMPTSYDVGGNRGEDFIQFELEVADKKKFAKYLGLSDAVLKKVDFDFQNDTGSFGSNNTRIEFSDVFGSPIDLSHDTSSGDEHYSNEFQDFDKADIPSLNEVKEILHAHDKFADLMDDSLVNLRNNYEFQFTDEALIEDAKLNEYDFDEFGDIV